VLEARDLWPGGGRSLLGYLQNSRVQKAAFALEGFLYRHARHLVVVSQGIEKGPSRTRDPLQRKASVIPNGVDTELFTPDRKK